MSNSIFLFLEHYKNDSVHNSRWDLHISRARFRANGSRGSPTRGATRHPATSSTGDHRRNYDHRQAEEGENICDSGCGIP